MKGEVVCRLLKGQSENSAGVRPPPPPSPQRAAVLGLRVSGRLQEGRGGDKMQILAMKAQSWILRLPCEKKPARNGGPRLSSSCWMQGQADPSLASQCSLLGEVQVQSDPLPRGGER